MKSILTYILFIFVLPVIACDFTVTLVDTYGDGWNGNSITITVNGTAVLSNITVATGTGPEVYNFSANDGDVIVVTYNASGSWQSENQYDITNDQGLPNFSDGMNGMTPVGGTFNADCGPPPPPPSNTDPCSADPLTVNAACQYITATTQWATNSSVPAPSCGFYNGGDLWFTAVVPASGLLTVQTGASVVTEMDIAIYTGTSCSNLTELTCDASDWMEPMGAAEVIIPDGLAGETVWIRVWEAGNDNPGIFNICAFESPPPPDYDALVNDSLVTGCLEAFNTWYTGNEQSISSFYDPNGSVGFTSGIILSSGDASNLFQPGANFESSSYNEPGDADLDVVLAGSSTSNDAAVLEFDFVPQSATLSFNYVFGSEEYPEWVYSFNDVFAFLLSGPNPLGGNYNNTNIALIPGTNLPVTIDNINDVGPSYPQYYIDNQNGPSIVLDGMTTVLTAFAPDGVIPCQTYHIKLAVADAGDWSYDSAVFLEAGSFTSGGSVAMQNYSNIGTENDIYEGCQNYYVFSRVDTADVADSLEIVITISGTAQNGVDITQIDSILYISAGEIYDTLFYDAYIDGLAEGTEYVVFTLESGGCPCNATTTSDTIYIFDNFDLSPSVSGDTMICLGQSVTLDLSINPAMDTALVDVVWSDGSTGYSITVTPNVTTTYTVFLQDPCSQDTAITHTIYVVPNINTTFVVNPDSVCINQSSTITFTGSAGPNAQYTWNFGSGVVVSGTGAGPYDVYWSTPGTHNISLSMDDNNCIGSANETITVFGIPTSSFTYTPNIICFGDAINFSYTGNAGPTANYTWGFDGGTILSGSGQGPISVSWNTAGIHTVSLEVKEFDCTSTITTMDILNPEALSISLAASNISCPNGAPGQVSFDVTGGISPYNYTWSTGDGTNLQAGNYTVTITDDLGCEDEVSFTISSPNPFVYSPNQSDLVCYNDNSGSITTSLDGGSPPYVYSWSHDALNQFTADSAVSGLPAGWYFLTITDDSLCTVIDSFLVTEPMPVVATITDHDDISCFAGSDGFITVSPSGGTPAYTYQWNDPGNQSGPTASNLVAGTYTIVLTDNNGCQDSASISLTEPAIFSATAAGTDATCFNGDDGTIVITSTGGTTPYFYSWNPAQINSASLNGLHAGDYTVVVSDVNGCTTEQTYTIGEPSQIAYTTSADSTTCYGYEDGAAYISIVPGTGTPGYNVLWSNNATGTSISSLASGYYQATITDANSCQVHANVFVPQPQEVITSVSPDTIICKNGTGHLTTSTSGGRPGYTYLWNTGATTSNITVNPEATSQYSVFSTDFNGCISETNTIKVYVRPPLTVNIIASTDSICPGDPIKFEVHAGGGDNNYLYVTNYGDTVNSIFTYYPNESQFVSVTVTDGCETNSVFDKEYITVMEEPPINFSSDFAEGCTPLSIQFNEHSPQNGQTYEWTFDDLESLNYSNLKNPAHIFKTPGTYDIELTVTSDFGCTSTVVQEQMITVYPLPIADFTMSPTATDILSPDVTFTNLSLGSSYCNWYFGDNSDTITNCNPVHYYTVAGQYDITLIAITEHGCRDTIYSYNYEVLDYFTFYAPTAFTPNGNSANELWSPMVTGLYEAPTLPGGEKTFRVWVYDRWGHNIYYSSEYGVADDGEITIGWDGKVYDKNTAVPGVYVWYVEYYDKDKKKHERNGTVTVIR